MRETVEGKDGWPISGGLDPKNPRMRTVDDEPMILRRADVDGSAHPRIEAPLAPSVRPRSHRRVLLGIRDLVFQQEVLDHLERDPRLEVVAAVAWPGALVQAMRDLTPDVTIACPTMVREIRHPAVGPPQPLMVVAEEMTVPVLREAIEAGAHGVFAWPDERAELAEEISEIGGRSGEVATGRGRVIAVYGTRGGSGTTFVTTQLAATFADQGHRCVLVDLDSNFADVTIALGIDREARTIADLVPVVGELGPDHLDDALFRHPRGFSVLLAPSQPAAEVEVPAGLYTAGIALLAGDFEIVVLHVPRGMDRLIRTAVAMADDVLLLVAPDLFSLHASRRVVQALGLEDQPNRCRIILNPASRGQIGRREIERVIGMAPFAAIRFDPAVARAQARGRLLPPRARRAAKDLRVMANGLVAQHDVPLRLPAFEGGVS
jgi:pilus assembly protein CpaE